MEGKKTKKAQTSAETVWAEFEKSKQALERDGYFSKVQEAYRFYNGDQWSGLKTDLASPSVLNVIKPIVDYKSSTVAKNAVCINFSPSQTTEEYEKTNLICSRLNSAAAGLWEQMNMDSVLWDMISDAAVCGESFAYFYEENGEIKLEQLDTTNVFFADEQECSIQKQRYIMITQRLFVDDVIAKARRNGLGEDKIALINSDNEKWSMPTGKARNEVETKDGKVLSVMKLWKENKNVHYLLTTKDVIYKPDTVIEGMSLYPLAALCWGRVKGSLRGSGEVSALIANQVEINKSLARLLSGIKQYAYPHVIYDESALDSQSVEDLGIVGSAIAVSSQRMQSVNELINYLEPAQINEIALTGLRELVSLTRELAGAGEGVTGAIDPEKTSGAAVIAVRDNAALPLNAYVASLRKFTEDVARIWFDMWCVYNPYGLRVATYYNSLTAEETTSADPNAVRVPNVITQREMRETMPEIKVNISPANPFSKYAHETALEKLFTSGYITMEEYVDALDEDSAAPKAKLSQILSRRKVQPASPTALSLPTQSSATEGGALPQNPTLEAAL